MDDYGIESTARTLAGKIRDSANDFGADTANRVRAKVNEASDNMQNTAGVAADEMRGIGKHLAGTVKDQPLMSLLLVGGIGMLMGLLMRR